MSTTAARHTSVVADRAEILRALSILLEPGQVTELRALDATIRGGWHRPQTFSGYFNDPEKLADAAQRIVSAVGVYFVPNPIDPALLARRANRIDVAGKDESTPDKYITKRRWLLIDADPERPAGISSTEEEHDAAIEKALHVRAKLCGDGWPDPILADSGNGAHLLYRIDAPAEDKGMIERCLYSLNAEFTDTHTDPDRRRVKIDVTTANASRIWKLYGTVAGKGDSIPERPHRAARLLEVPK